MIKKVQKCKRRKSPLIKKGSVSQLSSPRTKHIKQIINPEEPIKEVHEDISESSEHEKKEINSLLLSHLKWIPASPKKKSNPQLLAKMTKSSPIKAKGIFHSRLIAPKPFTEITDIELNFLVAQQAMTNLCSEVFGNEPIKFDIEDAFK